jgi:hypothetical protein
MSTRRIFFLGVVVGIPLRIGLFLGGAYHCFQLSEPISPSIPLLLGVGENGSSMTIVNHNDFDWTDIWLTVNGRWAEGGYGMALPKIPAGRSQTVDLDELAARDGRRFNPRTHKAIHLRLRAKTDRGNRRWAGDIP